MSTGPTLLDQQFLKPGDIARMLQVDPSTVYKWMKSGELPCVHVGPTAKRVPASALRAFIRRQSGDTRIETVDPETGTVDLVEPEHVGAVTGLADNVAAFEQETGMAPAEFCEQWRRASIEDTPRNAQLAIRALALREALTTQPA